MQFQRYSGFTLLEALITVALLAILIAVGVPSFRGMMDRNAVTATANDLLSSILLARSESVKREQTVIFSGNSDFSLWKVAADTDGDGAGDDVVLEHSVDGNGISVTANNITTISFNTRGRASLSPGSDYFTISKNGVKRYLCFNAIGRPRVQETKCQ